MEWDEEQKEICGEERMLARVQFNNCRQDEFVSKDRISDPRG